MPCVAVSADITASSVVATTKVLLLSFRQQVEGQPPYAIAEGALSM